MGRPDTSAKIADRLLRRLASGVYAPGERLPPTRELAAQFAVSLRVMMAAVRRVGSMGLLDVRQRQPVIVRTDAAAGAARRLVEIDSRPVARHVGLILPDSHLPVPRNAFYRALIGALTLEAARQGLRTSIIPWETRRQLAVANQLLHSSLDGAIFINLQPEFLASLSLLRDHGFPLLLFNRRIQGLDLPTVVIDEYHASQRVAGQLVQLGHRDLCMVANPYSFAQAQPWSVLPGKVAGWMDYLEEHGLLETCTMPIYMPWETHLGIYNRVFQKAILGPERPTAVVFEHNPYARSFLAEPAFQHLRVPDEISLATFEPTSNLPRLNGDITLSSIEINHTRTAQVVIETTLRLLGGDVHLPVIRVSSDMHLTESIGPAPSGGGRGRSLDAAT